MSFVRRLRVFDSEAYADHIVQLATRAPLLEALVVRVVWGLFDCAPSFVHLRELRVTIEFDSLEPVDLAPLASLVHLEELSLVALLESETPPMTVNLAPLSNLVNLQQFKLNKLSVGNGLEPLSQLSQLTALDLAHTTGSSVAPLARLRSLERLDVHDLSPLVISRPTW